MPAAALKGQAKTLTPILIAQLTDKQLRPDLMGCLAKVSKALGPDQIASSLISLLEGCDNPDVKVECSRFLSSSFEELQLSKGDSQMLMRSVLAGVTDRGKDVR